MTDERFYEAPASGDLRSAPAALRNREPISAVLSDWLPKSGLVLEIASGTGEHAVFFAERFPALDWQPTDIHSAALDSMVARTAAASLPNLKAALRLDASSLDWPIGAADAVLSINMDSNSCDEPKAAQEGGFDVVLNLNMVHISPWSAALGLLDGAARVLKRGGALILYGPWLQAGVETAPSNLAFDQQLRERDPEWGLRRVEDFDAEAKARRLMLEQVRQMPANNLMLLFRRGE